MFRAAVLVRLMYDTLNLEEPIRVASTTRINLEEPVRVASTTRINLKEPVRVASTTMINSFLCPSVCLSVCLIVRKGLERDRVKEC